MYWTFSTTCVPFYRRHGIVNVVDFSISAEGIERVYENLISARNHIQFR